MEVAVAILSPVLISVVSSALSSAVTKLGRVGGEAETDATSIRDELELIQGTIEEKSDVGRYVGPLESKSIVQLRRLAYDIEDCIDCFNAKKTSSKEFAEEIARLRERSEATRKRIKDYMKINGPPRAAPAAESPVPDELQEHLRRQGEDWFGNLNCLLYFSMFPPDHHARRNPLTRRWLAEGLVEGGEAKADKYLKDFIDGTIINTTAKSNNGMMKTCQPADGIHDFIRQQSRSADFMLFCEDMARLEADFGARARRLSLRPNNGIPDKRNFPDVSHLHTLAVFRGTANPKSYDAFLSFDKYKVLRVLDLKECVPLSEKHVSAICELLLLKYLSFRYDGTYHLPSEIGKLSWLETLDMRGSETMTVCKEILMMHRLKHLLGKFQLPDPFLRKIRPVGDWEKTELGKFLTESSCIETLSGFVTGERRGFPQLMILMRNLRKVKIWCKPSASDRNLGDVSSAITKFILDGLQQQPEDPSRSLSIDFHECPRAGQSLSDLRVEGGGSLTSLKLHGNLDAFPQFVAQLRGVEELCLTSTALSWDLILAGLSNLNILKYLKLVEDNLGRVEILPQHLRSLRSLCLVCVQNLNITIQAGALPFLESLHLICQHLDVVPGTPRMVITHMTDLQEVGLHSQLNQPIKQGWEVAAQAHPRTPRVSYV